MPPFRNRPLRITLQNHGGMRNRRFRIRSGDGPTFLTSRQVSTPELTLTINVVKLTQVADEATRPTLKESACTRADYA
jgi:hypothetical protein